MRGAIVLFVFVTLGFAIWMQTKADNAYNAGFEQFVKENPARFQTLDEARKAFSKERQKKAYKEYLESIEDKKCRK